jgi:hypothetical protein
MWVWLETFTPLLSKCVMCRGILGVGNGRFTGFFRTNFLPLIISRYILENEKRGM